MKTDEALALLDDKEFLDKIYRFSYHRCSTSFEAEDLCSDIILAVISALHKQESIDNFYAFAWTIVRSVYADYCRSRNAEQRVLSIEDSDLMLASKENDIDEWIEKAVEQEQIKRIFKEIAFLSQAYREVMILFYIDGLTVKEIAAILDITENAVKQRLFSARNSVRKEVENMKERAYVIKPVKLVIFGDGNPCGNDPSSKTERLFSQNLIYLCKEKPKSAKELSEELCVPMPYIEEELKIQCRGEDGKYGMLRKLDNGRFAVNIHLVDYDEYDRANKIYEKHLPEFCSIIKNSLRQKEEKILSLPYLSEQKNLSFIMWSFISWVVWNFEERVNHVLAEKYFPDVTPIKRNFSCVAIAYTGGQKPAFDFCGCDGIDATMVGGYKSVYVSNIYGKQVDKHFDCGHNLSRDPKLLMVLKSIGGIFIDDLSETEKEIAAKALECGYLRKKGKVIEPKMVVIDQKERQEFFHFAFDFNQDMGGIIGQIAAELSEFMRSHIPGHLLNEYPVYTKLISGARILSRVIDECVSEGLLSEPESRIGAEGMLMIVEK